MVLPPLEDKQPVPSEEIPEVTTQTEEVNVPEKKKSKTMEENIMEMLLQMNKKMDDNNKSTKEELGHKIENTNKKIEETSKMCIRDRSMITKGLV